MQTKNIIYYWIFNTIQVFIFVISIQSVIEGKMV